MPTCAMCNAAEVSNEGDKCENCGSADSGADQGGKDEGAAEGGDQNAGA